MTIQCLPASLHNRPELIPGALRRELEDKHGRFERVFVAYADCGTSGKIDQVLKEFGVNRLSGAHCYEFFAGSGTFNELADDEPGTFYLTDFLARHFERLVVKGLGLDKNPQLRSAYFANYKKLVYLSQSESSELNGLAREYADYLQLDFEHVHTGLGVVTGQIREQIVQWRN